MAIPLVRFGSPKAVAAFPLGVAMAADAVTGEAGFAAARRRFGEIFRSFWTRRGIDWLLVLGVIVMAVGLFFMFMKPPALSDQVDYLLAAKDPFGATLSHRHARVGLIWPISLLIVASGYSELAYYTVPLLTFVGLGAGVWLLARILFGRWEATIAALLILLMPEVLLEVSYVLPDYTSTVFFLFSVVLLCGAGAMDTSNPNGERRSQRPWVYFAAGALLGWSYLVREYMVLFFPVVAVLLILIRAPIRQWIVFSAGALICWLLELGWNWAVYNNPFARLETILHAKLDRPLASSFYIEKDYTKAILTLFDSITSELWVAIVCIGVAISVGAIFLRAKPWKFLGIWCFSSFVIFTAIAVLTALMPEHYALLRLQKFRYWGPMLPPMFILFSAALIAALTFAGKRLRIPYPRTISGSLLMVVLAVLVTPDTLAKARSSYLVRGGNTDYLEFRKFMRTKGRAYDRLWLDKGLLVSGTAVLPMYLLRWYGAPIWHGEVRFIGGWRIPWLPVADIKGGLIALDQTRQQVQLNFYGNAPDYLKTPEAFFHCPFKSSNGRIIVCKAPGAEASSRAP